MACAGCGRGNAQRDHCKFPSVDRVTGVEARLATPADAIPLFVGATARRERARAIRRLNAEKR